MSQNTSHAVMAQRHEAHDSLDDFPTQPWGARALVEHVISGHGWRSAQLREMTVWEPAANRGYMARPLGEYFGTVHCSDVHDYGVGYPVADFLFPGRPLIAAPDWIITNPPFRLGAQFVLRALEVATQGVAMLVRTSFVEGVERYRTLFKPHPPLIEAVFVERLPLVKGRVDPKASTATSYTWIVWPGKKHRRISIAPQRVWIPPCRKQLERPGDYDAPEPAA